MYGKRSGKRERASRKRQRRGALWANVPGTASHPGGYTFSVEGGSKKMTEAYRALRALNRRKSDFALWVERKASLRATRRAAILRKSEAQATKAGYDQSAPVPTTL